MSTALQNDVAPLWVWILVIAISSFFILLGLSFFIARHVIRRRKKLQADVEANETPTRRLTLREGKVIPNLNTTRLLDGDHDHDPNAAQDQDYPGLNAWWSKEKAQVGSPSTTDSPDASPSAIRHSTAPRLSLGSLDGKDSLSAFGSVSDLSVVSKPPTAAVNENPKPKAINFSRPQSRTQQAPAVTKRNRLSVINESTPRNSFISRIVSWASNTHDSESKKSGQTNSDKASRSDVNLPESKEDAITTSSPLLEALEELQRLAEAPTPELPSKNPSRQTSTSDDMTLPVGSRSSSINESRYKHSHKRSDSSTNFSRKGPYTSHSRSSSVTNYSRRPQITSAHSRESSNTSVFEEPQATLSGPFDDALFGMGGRESCASTISNDTEQAIMSQRQHPQQPDTRPAYMSSARSIASPDADRSTITTSDIPVSRQASITPSTSPQGDTRPRSRSRSRSRGPSRTTNRNGRTVLRKRSIQSPDITVIGPVDPSALENLSVVHS